MFPREAPQLRSDPVARIGSLRMMNRPHPAHANGFRFRRARRLFFCVAPGPGLGMGQRPAELASLWASRRDDINIAGF